MHRNRLVFVIAIAAGAVAPALAGPLAPPAGPVAASFKTLTEVEPRIAINATNTPGDGDSLYKITQPGSYYLTGNITGVSGKYGIEITSSGVSIDLNGFELFGGGAASGSLDGIRITGSVVVNTSIKNGSIRAWGGNGMDLLTTFTSGGTIADVASSENGSMGMRLGQRQVATRCTSYNNAGSGIDASSNCIISNCTATSNVGVGIHASANSNVSNCVAANNLQYGIHVTGGTSVSDCSLFANALDGIWMDSNCIVVGNVLTSNGFNSGDGAGIHAIGSSNRIEGNNCVGADRGIDVDAPGNLIIRNSCKGNTVNWSIVANNVVGQIVDRTAPASAAISGNSAPSSLGTTDANANLSY